MRVRSLILRKQFQRRAVKLLLLAGALLLATGAPARAATYYLAPGGNDSATGTSSGSPWLTLSKANSTLQPGDVVLLQPGTYSGNIAPARDGGSSSRISYVGSLASPGSVVVGAVALSGRSYISVKGVTSTADVFVGAKYLSSTSSAPAEYDSVLYVVGLAGLVVNGAHFSHVRHCTIGDNTAGDMLEMTYVYQDSTRFCTLEDNVFNLAGIPSRHVSYLRNLWNCTFRRNRFNIRSATSGDGQLRQTYTMMNCTFADNKYVLRNDNANLQDSYGFTLRDRCRFNSWTRDTFLVDPAGTYTVKYQFASAGNDATTGNHYLDGLHYDDWRVVDDRLGSNGYNALTNCYFQGDGIFGTNQRCHGYQFIGNTFVVKQALTMQADSLVFRHNTVMNTAGPRAVFGESQSDITNAAIRSNIFYGTGSSSTPTVLFPDAASVSSDSNLVYAAGGSSNYAFYVRTLGVACRVGPGGAWCDSYGKDCHSQWGDPQFASAVWASPDPAPRTGSIALSSGLWADGYVGAIGSGTSVGDLVPPGAINDLALALISDHTIVLRWTATGDDGTVGQASAYDLRWSNQPITASNFAAATPVAVQPVPVGAGTAQSYVLTDLVPSTGYYFALRAVDEAGNWSDIGVVLAATTMATDTVPPAPITLGP